MPCPTTPATSDCRRPGTPVRGLSFPFSRYASPTRPPFGACHTGHWADPWLFVQKIGQMCGALFIWMSDWYGRTWHIFFGCLGVCIGTIVTSLSTSLPMLIGGRFILSFAATCAHTAAPLYLVEIAPAAYRGTVAGLYNTFYYVVRRRNRAHLGTV